MCLFLSSQFTLVEVGTCVCISCVFGVFPQCKGKVILPAEEVWQSDIIPS